jgi:hypothetical protein
LVTAKLDLLPRPFFATPQMSTTGHALASVCCAR